MDDNIVSHGKEPEAVKKTRIYKELNKLGKRELIRRFITLLTMLNASKKMYEKLVIENKQLQEENENITDTSDIIDNGLLEKAEH